MGAKDFIIEGIGDTAEAAFKELVRRAEHDFGTKGYTGTIAEKDEFIMVEKPEGVPARVFARKVLREKLNPSIHRTYGPAGAIQTGDRQFLFFGWASC